MKTWFTSDTHFCHANIIKPDYCNRPFRDVEEMNEVLIYNWNSRVGPKDDVYHLGDFALARKDQTLSILKRLNGYKYLIEGNHESSVIDYSEVMREFCWIEQMATIKLYGERITLCHYAMRIWNRSHHGTWHLYGHSHGSLEDLPDSKSFDIGVDCHNFYPLEFGEVKEIMDRKTFIPIDHHTGIR